MRRRRDGRGFTLVEVLVAFAIAAFGLAALMQVFAYSLRNAAVTDAYTEAVARAESQLAAVAATGDLQPGEQSGTFNDGFRWQVSVLPYTEEGMDPGIDLFTVRVTVAWDDGGSERAVTLNTLRAGYAR